jgi:chorismate synthase
MNNFGRLFRIHIFGESHGSMLGISLDGVPAGISLQQNDFTQDLNRRKPLLEGTTARIEDDIPEIISGIYKQKTTGAPLTILFANKNMHSDDYKNTHQFRPGHADFTAHTKFNGFNDPRGGGHFSGRLTLALVAAGVVAKKIITPIETKATLLQAGGKTDIEKAIQQAIKQKDSIGGIIECIVSNMPVGLGEPFFDSLESMISHAIFSIPAIKGIEFGSGFEMAKMFGSEANDVFVNEKGETKTNHNGGILGGISNGNSILFRVAVKPTPSILTPQTTYNRDSKKTEPLEITGRHDTCIALRVPVVIEAVTNCVIADSLLIAKAYGL